MLKPPVPADSAEHLSEFGLIRRYFTRPARHATLGVGDDCALLGPRPGHELAISTDMLVAGRHFFADAEPRALGHKALAVNLSDLAAMGAEPRAFTLAMALPAADPAWLGPFADGLLALADAFHCELIGGDTTRGPLTLSLTVFGDVPADLALRRDAARPDDHLWVSGTVGDARLALGALRGEWPLAPEALARVQPRMDAPTPRVALGLALRGIARAALDVSDGLLGDLGHILAQSQVGATVEVDRVPRSATLAQEPPARQLQCMLAGGDDYELCFTAPAGVREAVLAAGQRAGVPVTRIGRIDAEPGLRLIDAHGKPVAFSQAGFDHFSSTS
ncbi:thiamine-phosphate kinase [Ralstonia pseudosolanacearum]|uniref:Thiamine-monophosphate kinase n=1 Tax=Ralstonia solanacearum TaxID=305 RepID=A0AA92JZF3_RALSL|nr:thiamine-phosphate kinase [Ralstonia pseudosolanacearum]QOK90661.1 thiamine-phosphate kinase [Ralstonia pseudosolanacearum]QOK95590.1 thiamine-phosphate kinase [Ralstonia pseudosolanacearum]UWD91617.1 thiamine-phosphate kinase [Ralstonia pseudosolanacearum]CAH0439599.1 Thiamine-monophosphate kinase [Ralstonia pseudosolanacearum]